MKRPKLNNLVTHIDPLSGKAYDGKVIQLLSAQFAYETSNGTIRLCMFNENWKIKHERN